MAGNAAKPANTPIKGKNGAIYLPRTRKTVIKLNGVEVPISIKSITAHFGTTQTCEAIDLDVEWEKSEDLPDLVVLSEMYADDPVIVALLGYVARTELRLGLARVQRMIFEGR